MADRLDGRRSCPAYKLVAHRCGDGRGRHRWPRPRIRCRSRRRKSQALRSSGTRIRSIPARRARSRPIRRPPRRLRRLAVPARRPDRRRVKATAAPASSWRSSAARRSSSGSARVTWCAAGGAVPPPRRPSSARSLPRRPARRRRLPPRTSSRRRRNRLRRRLTARPRPSRSDPRRMGSRCPCLARKDAIPPLQAGSLRRRPSRSAAVRVALRAARGGGRRRPRARGRARSTGSPATSSPDSAPWRRRPGEPRRTRFGQSRPVRWTLMGEPEPPTRGHGRGAPGVGDRAHGGRLGADRTPGDTGTPSASCGPETDNRGHSRR